MLFDGFVSLAVVAIFTTTVYFVNPSSVWYMMIWLLSFIFQPSQFRSKDIAVMLCVAALMSCNNQLVFEYRY